MAKPRITIVGLGLIGNSIGLALTQGQRKFEVVGHDKDNKAAGQSRKIKAVDKTEWNLISACDGADLVILALPAIAIRDTMQALAHELKPGCVVMDTASVKAPVQRWADEIPDRSESLHRNQPHRCGLRSRRRRGPRRSVPEGDLGYLSLSHYG